MWYAIRSTLIGVVLILMLVLWFRAFYAMFKAAANRKPGVSFFKAINGINLLFWDEPYTEVGNQWCKTYIRCMLGFILLFGSAAILFAISD